MARKPDYKGNIGYTHQPIAGVTLYQDRKNDDPSFQEMLENLNKSDINEKLKEELLARLEDRIVKLRGKKGETAHAGRNLKRYLVDPETGKIDIDEDEGDYTYKDALLLSASVKGKGGHFEEAINLIKTVTELGGGKKPQTDERPKEFYVDPETAVIIHDPENGECTLSEARAISQSMRGSEDKQKVIQYLNDEGKLVEAPAGQPIIITKKEQAQPSKTFFLNEAGELTEQEAGKPIVIKIQQGASGSGMPAMLPFPVMGSDGQPVLDKDGKPVYANLEPMMKYMAFQSEQRRADESHKTKLEIATGFKDLLGKAGTALSHMAEEEEEK